MRPACLFALASLLLTTLPATVFAQSATEQEARRQLGFARAEVTERNFEKALASADSALRLDPALYDAFVFKALAYEGLGDLTKAEGYLVAYSDLAGTVGQLPEADEALDRIRKDDKRAGGSVAAGDATVVTTALPDLTMDDLPALPSGSEALTAWLLIQHRRRAAEAQRNVGLALLAGGAALAGLGGGLVAGTSAASQTMPDDPNIESMHAAGLGSLFSGAVIFAVGLPLTLASAAEAGKLKRSAESLKASAAPLRLEAGATGLALRFP